jgi:hypothetical protein
MGDYVTVRPIRRRHPALGSAQRPFVLATLLDELKSVPASVFEAVDESACMVNGDSGQASCP